MHLSLMRLRVMRSSGVFCMASRISALQPATDASASARHASGSDSCELCIRAQTLSLPGLAER